MKAEPEEPEMVGGSARSGELRLTSGSGFGIPASDDRKGEDIRSSGSGRRVAVLTVALAAFAMLLMGTALAHTPHAPTVTVTWDAFHMTGRVNQVAHTAGTQTYSSWARSSWSHSHDMTAKIKWADRHCSGLCWWDFHGEKVKREFNTAVTTDTLTFTASACRYYKFYGGHISHSHGSSELAIDEPQGVVRFEAGNC